MSETGRNILFGNGQRDHSASDRVLLRRRFHQGGPQRLRPSRRRVCACGALHGGTRYDRACEKGKSARFGRGGRRPLSCERYPRDRPERHKNLCAIGRGICDPSGQRNRVLHRGRAKNFQRSHRLRLRRGDSGEKGFCAFHAQRNVGNSACNGKYSKNYSMLSENFGAS